MALILLGWVLSSGFRWARNPLHAAFLALAIAMLLGWQASGRPDLGEKPVSDWFKVALFYVIVVTTVRDERDLKRLATMYVAAVAAYMAHSLWEYRNGRYQWTMGTVRLLGIDLTMGDPNTFAATILYSLPVALALWPQARKAWQHALLAGYGLLSLACILLTSSRSAFVGVCFLGVVVAVASKHRLTLVLLMAACAPLAWRCAAGGPADAVLDANRSFLRSGERQGIGGRPEQRFSRRPAPMEGASRLWRRPGRLWSIYRNRIRGPSPLWAGRGGIGHGWTRGVRVRPLGIPFQRACRTPHGPPATRSEGRFLLRRGPCDQPDRSPAAPDGVRRP